MFGKLDRCIACFDTGFVKWVSMAAYYLCLLLEGPSYACFGIWLGVSRGLIGVAANFIIQSMKNMLIFRG